MNSVSIIPAPVAAQISGPGSFFGSCQIASGNFEDILSAMSGDIINNVIPDVMSEFPAISSDSENLVEQPVPLDFTFQDFDKSEVLMQLQQILGEDAGTEAYERIVNLLEKGTLSVHADTLDLDKNAFEKLTVSLLERLDIAIKQITKAPVDEQDRDLQVSDVREYENKDNLDREKFLNLITDLLKTGMITPQEYETALKNPEESSLPELFGELKKEAVKLIEKLENVEEIDPERIVLYSPIEEPSQIEQPSKVEQPKQAEQPKQVEPQRQGEQPRQTEQFWRAERPVQVKEPSQVERTEQIEQPKQPRQVEQPRQTEQPIRTELYSQVEHTEQTEQPKQPRHIEQPWQTEVFRQVEKFSQAEQPQPKQAEQPISAESMEQPRQVVQTEQNEPLLEELRVISMEMETGIQPKDKAKFHELINNLLEKGLINEQDLKNIVKIPAIDDESSSPIEPISKSEKNDAEKTEPVFIKSNVLEKIWTNFESENKVEKENIFSKIKEIVESKSISTSTSTSTSTNTSAIASGEKIDFKHAKVEVEVRAVWEAGDLKIETVNPKTGEKLQSIPVANSHRMQERIHEFEVVRQVVSQAKFITTPTGEQKLTMQLRPEHLGQMNLRIVLNNGEMQIHARVESITAQAALESHIGLLREGLEKQGINLERLEVSVEQRDRQDAFSLAEKHEQHERHGNGKHHHRNKEMHLAVSVKKDVDSDTGRRLGYNTMEYLA
ncbi:MAG: flagellar hook-length control protein FliK [Fibromonadaceae bacterium]|jgi:flagellar hook-length control protein FliK|nr:flagellar hook-length control protein FliK [Fibromonadaceae bacterium]